MAEAYTVKGSRSVQRALLRWHAGNSLSAPWRRSRDPYQCLVAAVMAQQTQMSRVLQSYDRFVAAFPTLDDLAAATPGRVIRVWEGMGYNQRAVRLHRAAQVIAATGWPRDAASLGRIDGIGPFTAAIIASFAFGEPAGCVDTNVRRVLGRLAGDEQMPAAALQRLADAMVPVDAPAEWNQAVMDYGARVCVPRPKCGECVVSRWCSSREGFATATITDRRSRYRTRPAQPAYEGSLRWYRGRIIDVLRSIPPGRTITVAALTKRVAGDAAIDQEAVDALLERLESDRLVVRRGRLVSLPRLSRKDNAQHLQQEIFMAAEVIKVGQLGPYGNNAYIIADHGTRQAIVVDAPIGSSAAIDVARPYDVRGIVLTHRHADHWAEIDAVKSAFSQAPAQCHDDDREPYAAKVDATIADGDEITLGETRLRVMHTPGHTPGSICLLVPAAGGDVLISGDTLFPGGPGRSDSPQALQRMIQSIASRLLVLEDSVRVLPGHGDDTTIGDARREYAAFAAREHDPKLCGDVTWAGA